jgi:ABC-type transporter Mla MlaB component
MMLFVLRLRIPRVRRVEYEVNPAGTEYLDSSALGMLLLLREHAGGDTSIINITKVSDDVRKMLDVANFGRLFNI